MEYIMPPNDIQAEQSIIGCMLSDTNIIPDVINQLEHSDFYDNSCGIIYHSISELIKLDKPIDLITIKDQLKSMPIKINNPKFKGGTDIDPFIRSNKLKEIGGVLFLTELIDGTPHISNHKEYLKIILLKANLRKIINIIRLTEKNIFNNLGPDDVIKNLENGIRSITTTSVSGDIKTINELLYKRIDELQEILEDNNSQVSISTGYKDLDLKMGPLMGGNLILIGGRPGSGKTGFVMNIINNNIMNGKKVAFFSMEMNDTEIINRFISMNTDMQSHQLKKWGTRPDGISKEVFLKGRERQLENIQIGLENLLDKELHIDSSTNLTPKKIRSRLSRITMKKKLDLIVIDYIGLMKSDIKGLNKTNEVGDISRELKIMAGEYNCPIIVITQLNREVEKRADKRPIMPDIRNSGDLEQDANIIMFLYRDLYYNSFSFDDTLEIIISKNRDGSKGTINLEYDLQKQLVTTCSLDKLKKLKEL